MTQNSVITLALVLAAVLLVVGVVVYNADGAPRGSGVPEESASPPSAAERADLLVREDSRYLSRAKDADVTVVEFLDFECEACRAQFPAMERLREEYEGRVNVVIRYFPMPGHTNSRPAAAAVEAAAQQGALEEMYVMMYETQAGWGESQESKAELFVSFAKELDLDIGEFRETVDSPATEKRIDADFEDGVKLGVQGTPTIFVNGRQTESMPDYSTLSSMVDAELGE
ncbi:protein-disulfide isomerase [Murinocardiopsis flavida]|uniref:Protein-disulfide isomerase n=1 Tax=Murinocardiopsis flavida TaxID=645275 RepID=A0A2P8CT18_9ACTN|nr:DsbA family protein [Murinocardiopsis flavida]PSK88099.1 protein-disulfide isomerase [Murinocardiopsis flavida]